MTNNTITDLKPSTVPKKNLAKDEQDKLETQSKFLEYLCNSGISVSIYLKSGVRLEGKIINYDDYSILLKATAEQLVYKHAICSILPSQKT